MSIFLGNSPKQQHIQALADCKLHLPGFVSLLEEVLASTKDTLVRAEDSTRIHRLQGQAATLRDLLDAIDAADEVKRRMDTRSS